MGLFYQAHGGNPFLSILTKYVTTPGQASNRPAMSRKNNLAITLRPACRTPPAGHLCCQPMFRTYATVIANTKNGITPSRGMAGQLKHLNSEFRV